MKQLSPAALMLLAGLLILTTGTANARDVSITEDMPYAEVSVGGKTIRIERIQNTSNKLTNSFARTSRKCPPFCVHPMKAADGVETAGEIELINFLKIQVKNKTGLLIDARIPDFYKKGTIPGSINIPFTLFAGEKNPYLDKILAVLGGVRKQGSGWDFSKAMELMLFCNGPWCDQSPRALKSLIAAGYPAEKLHYYRGGMQSWQSLGLTVTVP